MPEAATLSGVLHADFVRQHGRTSARIARASAPLELRGPFARGSTSSFFLRNVSCGVFAGDRYDVGLRAAGGARVVVSSSSATKAHAMPAGLAVSRVHLEAEAGSLLAYTDGPTILQAGSDYEQHVEITAGEGVVIFAEIIVLGRLARGEYAAFARYASEIVVADPCGRTLFVERYTLAPQDRDLFTAASAAVIGKVLLVGSGALDVVMPAPLTGPAAYASQDLLPNGAGFAVRFLSDRLEPVLQSVTAIVSHLATHP